MNHEPDAAVCEHRPTARRRATFRRTCVGRTLTRAVLASLVGAGVTMIGQSAPAGATAAQCENGANGFVDISDSLRGAHAPTASNPKYLGAGVYVRLYYGTVYGATRGWAMIDGSTISGDQVWMDWTVDNGATIKVRCGPFYVSGPSKTKTSAAKRTSSLSSYRFRACGALKGQPASCTAWW